MKSPELALRFRGGDRHHLFNNNGTWFVRYCVREERWLKASVRVVASLGTKDFAKACERRDAFLAHLEIQKTALKGVLSLAATEGRAA